MHPRPRHWRLLDYVFVRRRDQQDMFVKKGEPGCRLVDRPSPRHLQDEDSPTAWQRTSSCRRGRNTSVENRWCQLRETVQLISMAVLRRACPHHQDWFDDNDAAIGNLLPKKNHLHKVHVNCPTDDSKTVFYRGRRLVQQRLRGISLLSIAIKIFARIPLNRLSSYLEGLLPESQCCFRRHQDIIKRIFAARQLQECQEIRIYLYSTFLDPAKAFDTVDNEGLWKVMQKFDCLERLTQIVRQLYNGMMARVTDNGAVSRAFAMTKEVKQGCVLAPTLLSLMLTAILIDAQGSASPTGRTANSSISGGCPSSRGRRHARVQLQAVVNFTYLGTTPSRNTKIDIENASRISKASHVFGRPQDTIWDRHGLHCSIKLNMYNAVILPAALNGSEAWTAKKQARRLKHFNLSCPRRILKLTSSRKPLNIPPSISAASLTPTINTYRTHEPPRPPHTVTPTSAAAAPVPTTTAHNPDAPSNINLTTANTSDVHSVQTCPYCDRTFTPHTGLVGHLRIYRTDWRTIAWNIKLHSSQAPSLSTLSLCAHSSHGPDRTHARRRKPEADNRRLHQTIASSPTDTPHHTTSQRIISTQLAPPAQVGSVLLGSFSMRPLCCMCNPSLRPSAVAWKAAV
nr:unnamed protein product [Spirometra erinaceieuropaei]